jgi:hypothetical protein
MRFVLDYHGSLSGSWRNTRPVIGGLTCIGHDVSGTFTSTVRPGRTPYAMILENRFGRIEREMRPDQPKGTVTSVRTAQGWMMRYSGGQCQQVPKDQSGCRANTFAGQVGFDMYSRDFGHNVNRVYFDWEAEPETLYCDDGIRYDQARGTSKGQLFDRVVIKTLWRCGVRKGRRCRMKVGKSNDFPFQATQNEETYTSQVHVEWSVTLRLVSRR